MTPDEIEMLITHGEDEKIEFKKELHISDVEAKAEFIRDMISLVNAHGAGSRYLIIGVEDRTKKLFDIQHLNLDDSPLQAIVEAHIEPHVQFSYRSVLLHGKIIGVFEILQSHERFHLVKKPLFKKDANSKDQKLLVHMGGNILPK